MTHNNQPIPIEEPLIVQLQSGKPGAPLAIMVGVHGNEKGPQLEWDWIQNIALDKGSLYVIFANPTAAKLNQRFVNVNLNRRFGKNLTEFPEDSSARLIEKTLDKCTALLDLHMYNEDLERPFVICNPASNEVAKKLPANYIVNLMDDDNIGGSDDYMFLKGKVGVCFECGSSSRPDAYSSKIRTACLNFLKHYSLIDNASVPEKDPTVLLQTVTKIRESSSFSFARRFSSFDQIKRGEIIAIEGGKQLVATKDCFILFPRPKNPIGAEAYYLLEEV